jgi:RNA polymerase sigma factor (sigma-70 family)
LADPSSPRTAEGDFNLPERPENEMQSGAPIPNEPDALTEDLQLYEYLARHSGNPNVREDAARLVRLAEWFERSEEVCAKAANQLGLDTLCKRLSTQIIATFLALPDPVKENPLRKFLHVFVERNCERLKRLPGWNYEMFLTFCCCVFRHALRQEYLSRRQKNESLDGRAVREILVEEQKRGKLLKDLADKKMIGRFFPGEIRFQAEDAPAEAMAEMWERISEYTKTSPVAADPNALRAFMEGALNRIPQHSRDRVRTLIETENRRLIMCEQNTDQGDGSESQQDSSSAQAQPRRVLVELETIPDKRSCVEDHLDKILVEQLLTTLEPRDKELITLSLEGYTEREVAARLGMTQSAVSKRLHTIQTKLKKAVQGSPQTER